MHAVAPATMPHGRRRLRAPAPGAVGAGSGLCKSRDDISGMGGRYGRGVTFARLSNPLGHPSSPSQSSPFGTLR